VRYSRRRRNDIYGRNRALKTKLTIATIAIIILSILLISIIFEDTLIPFYATVVPGLYVIIQRIIDFLTPLVGVIILLGFLAWTGYAIYTWIRPNRQVSYGGGAY